MAVRLDASADEFTRTTNLPSRTSWTMCGWVRVTTDAYSLLFEMHTTSGSRKQQIIVDRVANVFALWQTDLGADAQGSAISNATWYHMAATCSGTGASTFLGYLNGVLDITTSGGTHGAANTMYFGNGLGNEFINGCIAACKVWDAVLTAEEIRNEMSQYLPVRTANINCFHPFLSIADDQVDYSGLGRTLTVGGTMATEDGPPIPWKMG